ncbi:ABC transporter ATP-binding protein [Erythrobacter dokdonensis]|uniref:ABC transporter ATP-binding protein n=1 Tax=Erythrobacter dokdonensis DSW-74 TaxID=1300349 RepID=A0A1A7BF96_9SPHN|nr:ABC transporter ATP-binding protein [Erythrobacter dokdonensis]OBV11198.1 ABC transporter ATP-binding protein [Erythrobacter dokdonensis DSW-74]
MNLNLLWNRARPFIGEIATLSGLSLLSSLAALAIPWLAGNFLAGVVGDVGDDLYPTVALLLTALVTLAIINIVVAVLSEHASGRILAGLRREVYAHIQAMPLSFHDHSRSGDLLALMTYEVENLSRFLTATLANVPAMIMTAAGASLLLFLIDPTIGLIVPIIVPVFFILARLFGRRLRNASRRFRKAETDLIMLAESDLEMISATKAFATEDSFQQRYGEAIEKARVLAVAQARLAAVLGPALALAAAIAAIAILVAGNGQIDNGGRTPGEVFTFLLYAALLTRPVGGLAETYGAFQIARGTLARLENVLSKPIEDGYAGTVRLGRAQGAIRLENVKFAYPGRPTIFDGLNLSIAPGQIVALTGENGLGKSTLVRLLLRFYEIDSGRITLDGIDISDLQIQDLRRQFGYVPQQPLLFNGTIAQNIAFDATDPDPVALKRAIDLAQASEFIDRLPHGLSTRVGDHGVRLSGGQRQRIALARALLRDPPIYILDEATSMYDLDSEAAFVEACIGALKGRTVIIISHRPASLALADRVLDATDLRLGGQAPEPG